MSRRKLLLRRVLPVALVVLACQQAWRHGRDYIFAEEFATVEPGRIYRGAWQQEWPMRRIVEDYHIKTIVALAHPPDNPLVAEEKTLAGELGVRWVHIPIVDTREPGDPTVSERLVAAAAAIADPANQPVFFHCHHGVNRASMVQMAYRMIHCGWDLDRAERRSPTRSDSRRSITVPTTATWPPSTRTPCCPCAGVGSRPTRPPRRGS